MGSIEECSNVRRILKTADSGENKLRKNSANSARLYGEKRSGSLTANSKKSIHIASAGWLTTYCVKLAAAKSQKE